MSRKSKAVKPRTGARAGTARGAEAARRERQGRGRLGSAPAAGVWGHAVLEAPRAGAAVWARGDAWLLLAALAAYAFSRGWGMLSFPIQYDEGSHLHWAFVVYQDWSQRFIMSGWGGKQPLFIWLISFFDIFVPNAVLAGRLVTFLAGAGTAMAVWLVARRMFGRSAAWISVFAYVVVPYHTVFDRVAVIDGFVASLAMWTLYLSLRVHEKRWLAAPLALLIAAGLLSKTSNLLYLPLIALGPLAAPDPRQAYRRALPALVVAALVGYIIYFAVFGGSEGAAQVTAFEAFRQYSMGAADLLRLPFGQWAANIGELAGFLWGLLTPPLALLLAPAVVWGLLQRRRNVWVLLAWGLVPVGLYLLVALGLFSRYFLFSIPPLLIVMSAFGLRLALAIGEWRERAAQPVEAAGNGHAPRVVGAAGRLRSGVLAGAVMFGLLGVYPASQSLLMALNPAAVRLPASAGMVEYIDNGTYGLWAARDYLLARASSAGDCYVLLPWFYEQTRDAAYALFAREPNIKTLSVAGWQNGQFTPSAEQYVILDTGHAQPEAVTPADLAQRPCVYYLQREQSVEGLNFRDALKLEQRFANVKGRPELGLYTVTFDQRFLTPEQPAAP